MPYTAQAPEISLPDTMPRPVGRFLDVAENVTAKWDIQGANRMLMGAKFMAPGPYSPIVEDFDCDTDDDKSEGTVTQAEQVTSAFLMFNLFECSTLSGTLEPEAELAVDVFRKALSEALTRGLMTQVSSTHLNFADDSTALATASSAVEALATVEYGLAQRISNEQGYVFVSNRYFTPLYASGAIVLRDGMAFTPLGHKVISDAGHDALGTIYGTGALGYATTDVTVLDGAGGQIGGGAFNRPRNTIQWLVENYGIVVFNPQHTVRATWTGAVSG